MSEPDVLERFLANPGAVDARISRVVRTERGVCALHLVGSGEVAQLRFSEAVLRHGQAGGASLLCCGEAVNVAGTCVDEVVRVAVDAAYAIFGSEANMTFMPTTVSEEWATAPTAEVMLEATPQGVHPEILAAISAAPAGTVVVDDPQTNAIRFTMPYSIEALRPVTCEAWNLRRGEPLLVQVSVHREHFLARGASVTVTQTHHETSRCLIGAAGQLTMLLNEVCRVAVVVGSFREAAGTLAAKAGLALPPPAAGANGSRSFLADMVAYIDCRLLTLSDYCVVCDERRTHACGMPRMTTCSRTLCIFRFQTLHVGKGAAERVGVDPLVASMLVAFTNAAGRSGRWEHILDPYPEVLDDSGYALLSHKVKDQDVLLNLLNTLPADGDVLSAKLPPLAANLVTWIITSNASYVRPLEHTIPFMRAAHQFILLQSSQRHAEAFERFKATKKTVWAFHGSPAENWHSIFRNGLVSASGTKLQINGAAYGAGIYLSPDASTSYSYSKIDGSENADAKGPPKPFIAGKFHCITICEVIDEDIKRNGSIWVQPKPEYVMTRFFFVFVNQCFCGNRVNLGQTEIVQQLNDALAAHTEQQ